MRKSILSKLAHRRMHGGRPSFLGAVMVVAALAAMVAGEQCRAQLYIDVYESRDNPGTSTLWVFSGSSTAAQLYSVRNSTAGNANFGRRDSWEVSDNSGALYVANAPSNEQSALTSVAALNAVSSRDRWYVANVLTNVTTVMAPTASFQTGGNAARTRAISHLFMNDDPGTGATNRDELGIRVSGVSFAYSANDASSWSGAGILAKPFSDFYTGTVDGTFSFNNLGTGATSGPRFAAGSDGSVVVRFHRGTLIPEPAEYALVFGLFALGFVIVRRHFQKKRQQAATAA